MLNAILIDDEPDSLKLLQHQLAKHCPEVIVLAACNTPEEGLTALRSQRVDLLFLDIEMPRMNGFALLESLGDLPFHLVFTTAYDRYAVRAFRFNALDYLLKPIDEQELILAVQKAKTSPKPQAEQLAEASKSLSGQIRPDKIAIPTRDRYVLVPLTEIVYCESDKSYTTIYLNTGIKHLISKPLGEIEEMLSGPPFFRIHKQYLVNVEAIDYYSKGESASVNLLNGVSLPISRYRLEAFKALFL